MSEEAKQCPSCGKRLRSNNKRGFCSACLSKAGGSALLRGERKAPSTAAPKRARAEDEEVEDGADQEDASEESPGTQRALFDALTGALGIDGEALIASAVDDYCRVWIADLRAKAWCAATSEPRRSLPPGD